MAARKPRRVRRTRRNSRTKSSRKRSRASRKVFEVDTNGYSSASARSWDSIKLLVKKVYIDSSIGPLRLTNCAYRFNSFSSCTEVSGFENLASMSDATQMFTSCSSLETIYATSFTNHITSSTSMFYGCNKLVGDTDGFVPTSTSAGSVCNLGAGGVLTDPANDAREWFKVFVYDDGLIEFTTAGAADATRTLLDAGRMCANAKYQAVGVIPGYSYRTQFRTVSFNADMTALSLTNMNYWLYGLTAVTSVTGWSNLSNVTSMRYAMNGCTGVTSLDMTGLDPSTLTDLFYAFAGCSALTTIYVGSTWTLPAGASGMGTFYKLTKHRRRQWDRVQRERVRLCADGDRHGRDTGVSHGRVGLDISAFRIREIGIRLFAEANALDHFSGKSFRNVRVVVLRPNLVPTCQMAEVVEIDGRFPDGYAALGLNLDIHDEAFYLGCLYARDALLGFKDNLLELIF